MTDSPEPGSATPSNAAVDADTPMHLRLEAAVREARIHRYLALQAARAAARAEENTHLAEAARARMASRYDVLQATTSQLRRDLEDARAQLHAVRPDDPAHLFRTGAAERRRMAKTFREDPSPEPTTAHHLEIQADVLDAAASVLEGNLDPLYDWLPTYQWTAEMRVAIGLNDGGERP